MDVPEEHSHMKKSQIIGPFSRKACRAVPDARCKALEIPPRVVMTVLLPKLVDTTNYEDLDISVV